MSFSLSLLPYPHSHALCNARFLTARCTLLYNNILFNRLSCGRSHSRLCGSLCTLLQHKSCECVFIFMYVMTWVFFVILIYLQTSRNTHTHTHLKIVPAMFLVVVFLFRQQSAINVPTSSLAQMCMMGNVVWSSEYKAMGTSFNVLFTATAWARQVRAAAS